MKQKSILLILLIIRIVCHAQTSEPDMIYRVDRQNQKQRLITLDAGLNYSYSGNTILYGDTTQWTSKPIPGPEFGISFVSIKRNFFVIEHQLLYSIERQKFDKQYISSIPSIGYFVLFGYRMSDDIKIKAGVGAGKINALLNKNSSSPLYNHDVSPNDMYFRFKTEISAVISPKVFLTIGWSSGFGKPLYQADESSVSAYRSMLIAFKFQYCLFNKQSLIQNQESLLKFSK